MTTVKPVEMARILIHEAERTRLLKITPPYCVNPQSGSESLPDEVGHLIGGADLFLRWRPAVNRLINGGLQGEHLADSCLRAPDLDGEGIFVLLVPGLEHPWQVVGAIVVGGDQDPVVDLDTAMMVLLLRELSRDVIHRHPAIQVLALDMAAHRRAARHGPLCLDVMSELRPGPLPAQPAQDRIGLDSEEPREEVDGRLLQ